MKKAMMFAGAAALGAAAMSRSDQGRRAGSKKWDWQKNISTGDYSTTVDDRVQLFRLAGLAPPYLYWAREVGSSDPDMLRGHGPVESTPAKAIASLRRKMKAMGRRAAQGDPVAARELVLYAVNDGRIYPMRQNVEEGLRKKIAKGRFDAAKAPQAYAAWLETAAKQYNREFGSPGVSWHRVFDAPTRRLAAQEMVDDFLAEEGVQGQRSRKIWLGMQGLPARGRRATEPFPMRHADGSYYWAARGKSWWIKKVVLGGRRVWALFDRTNLAEYQGEWERQGYFRTLTDAKAHAIHSSSLSFKTHALDENQ